ncbi:MAG: DUF4440 domain-containing protein [Cyclobacteriaceae bacterium]
MNSTILLFPLLFAAQPDWPESLKGLVQAERDFASLSIEVNTRHAFVSNMDDNSIAFQKGEPVNGLATWSANEANEGYLFWWPVYADIASSGDFGYTTGPAEWGPSRTEKTATGGTYYSTVWTKNSEGQWRVAIDMGSARYTPGSTGEEVSIPSQLLKPSAKKVDTDKSKQSLTTLDKSYLDLLNKNKKSIDPAYFHSESRIHHGGREPVTTQEEIQKFEEPGSFSFEHIGCQVARSGDMGFTYGKVKLDRERDGQTQTLNLNYLRVWKVDNGNWKIVLDVIGG